jgi:membrane associated rhomboid family serine protease
MHIGCSGLAFSYSIVSILYNFKRLLSRTLSFTEYFSYYFILHIIITSRNSFFPNSDMISWQMHIAGLIIGLFYTVMLLHKRS